MKRERSGNEAGRSDIMRRGFPTQSDEFILHRFDYLPPDEHREISRRGGIASGRTRRAQAIRRDIALNELAKYYLTVRTDKEFLQAVLSVMEKEGRKRARRKPLGE